MTVHTDRNHAVEPRAVHGPLSMPRICASLHHQLSPVSTNSVATTANWARDRPPASRRPAAGLGNAVAAMGRQAAQEKSAVDRPLLPSYSMPKALIRDRV